MCTYIQEKAIGTWKTHIWLVVLKYPCIFVRKAKNGFQCEKICSWKSCTKSYPPPKILRINVLGEDEYIAAEVMNESLSVMKKDFPEMSGLESVFSNKPLGKKFVQVIAQSNNHWIAITNGRVGSCAETVEIYDSNHNKPPEESSRRKSLFKKVKKTCSYIIQLTK